MTPPDSDLVVRALTVRQPWAWAIIHAGKDVENRTRPTVPPYRLLIHSARTHNHNDDKRVRALARGVMPGDIYLARYFASIIGYVDVVDCVTTSRSRWAQPGSYHWVLANPVPIKRPLVVAGRQGLFTPPANWQEYFA